MSQFYDKASLVVVPSGYKAGTVYAQKPLTTDGQLTFTRTGDTATRVNSAGIIEKVRTNLALYSEDWSNWSLFQASVTANTTANPLTGALTADTLTKTTTNSGVSYRSVSTGLNVATFSAYLKAGTHNLAQIGFTDGIDYGVSVNLTLGTITSTTSGITGTITSVGNGWYRITGTRTISTTATPTAFVNVISGAANLTLIVYGAQVELGEVATSYIPTTTAAVSVGPVANVPRLDYLGSTCPRLLLEPQRTNLVTYSEQFNNAAWDKSNITVTANAAISPDGYTNADLLNITSVSNYIDQAGTIVSGSTYTVSCYVKSAVSSSQTFRLYGNANKSSSAFTATQVWQRFTHTFTADSTAMSTGIVSSALVQLYVYGFQLEAGAYATSYIPTLAASATRGADACSKTGISSLIGQTEGVLFYDFVWNGNPTALGDYPVIIYGGSYNDFLGLSTYGSAPSFYSYVGGSNVVAINGSTMVVGQRYKMAMAYKLNDYAFYVNGTQVGVDTSAGIPASMANVRTDNPFSGRVASTGVNQAILFKTRLTNAELAQLTAL